MRVYLRRFHRIIFFTAGLMSILGFIVLFLPQPAAAQGETYQWITSDIIEGSGGHFAAPAQFKFGAGADNAFSDRIGYTGGHCTADNKYDGHMALKITLQGGESSGQLEVIYSSPDFGANGKNYSYACDIQPGSKVQNEYQNQMITIGCQRSAPCKSASAENDDQKAVHIMLLADQTPDVAPQSVTVTVKTRAGDVVGQPATVAPIPDTTRHGKAVYGANFALDPGDYTVCATAIIAKCEDFTKAKYTPLTLYYGANAASRIDVTVEIEYSADCSQEIADLGPLTLSAAKSDPKEPLVLAQTDVAHGHVYTLAECSGKNGEVADAGNVVYVRNLTLHGSFEEITPDTYRVCVSNSGSGLVPVVSGHEVNADGCGSVTTKKGETAQLTIKLAYSSTEQVLSIVGLGAKVCKTGTSWSGVAAFLYCPFTKLVDNFLLFMSQNFQSFVQLNLPFRIGAPGSQ